MIFDFSEAVHIDDSAAMTISRLIITAGTQGTQCIAMGLASSVARTLRELDTLRDLPRNHIVETLDEAREVAPRTPGATVMGVVLDEVHEHVHHAAGHAFHASVPCGEGHFEQTRELLDGLTECALNSSSAFEQFLLVDDGVAVEDGAARVAGQAHGAPLGARPLDNSIEAYGCTARPQTVRRAVECPSSCRCHAGRMVQQSGRD